jgi:hypothetical protein
MSMSYLATQPARASGTFTVGGDLPVMRLGYGAMQVPATRSSACCAAPSSSASRSSTRPTPAQVEQLDAAI